MKRTLRLDFTNLLVRRVVLSFVFVAIAVSLFAILARDVHTGETLAFDQSILRAINQHATPFLNTFFLIVTQFGGVAAVTLVSICLFAYLLRTHRRNGAVLIAAGVGGTAALNFIAKLVFERARPDLWQQLASESTYSFPSGHAAGSCALALCIVVLLWRTKWRFVSIGLAILYIITIGFSRLYLGVHYPTDIVAGWTVAAVWVSVVATILYTRRHKPAKEIVS